MIDVSFVPFQMLLQIEFDIANDFVLLLGLHFLQQLQVFGSLSTRPLRYAKLWWRYRTLYRWYIDGLLLGLWKVSGGFFKTKNSGSYLLVDEILIIVLDAEFPFHVLYFRALLEDLLFDDEHLFSCKFTLSHESNQLSRILQFFAKPAQFLGTLRIPTTSLADLSHFASTETYIWIAIIGFLARFELHKGMISNAYSPLLPVFIYVLGKSLYMLVYSGIEGVLNLGV
ncbi:hypothetical protein TMatcc_010526 [Talaromyces marneffei ATCC 18224]